MESIVGRRQCAGADRRPDAVRTQQKYEYRYKWRSGDWVLLDNRSVMHQVNADYDMSELRLRCGLMLKGEAPV